MLLLDSQAVLWLLDDSPKFGSQARMTITEATRVYVSAASVWELTIKAMLGKLTMPAGLSDRLLEQGLFLLNVTSEDAEAIRRFPELAKHDPFDRLIIAQASLGNLRLVTADRVLLALDRDFLIDATV
ncbi:type II toxin-antitoxin system VapC family toxin [Allorhizocola rhizosphaerae]|uniref:type II toxin-antitoxin system VapC family toxin n=1 Tax=Allorhizocola rhizosphaerae TaxID=1872709 RepID=UPI000E3E9FF1|nr:type II toxin-antitoxin system VapC family toxin [Allorhizocola rhizosphaerae]